MWGKEPQCIITDQDIAMRNTISNVVSLTKYRYCSWYIRMNGRVYLN